LKEKLPIILIPTRKLAIMIKIMFNFELILKNYYDSNKVLI